MIKIIAPHANTSLLPINNVLFVLQPWTLKLRNDSSWMAVREFRMHYRANPRNSEYMLDLANAFIHQHAKGANYDLVVGEDFVAEIPEKYRAWPSHLFTKYSFIELSKQNYDTIVLLYHDPLGLGWEDIEKFLKRLNVAQYIVINGRRREFVWDQEAQRAIAVRRLIAKMGWLEVFLAPWLWITATFFYLCDLITGETRSEA